MPRATLLTTLTFGLALASLGCSGLTRSEDFKIRKDPVVEPEAAAAAQAPGLAAQLPGQLPGAAVAQRGLPGGAPARPPGSG